MKKISFLSACYKQYTEKIKMGGYHEPGKSRQEKI